MVRREPEAMRQILFRLTPQEVALLDRLASEHSTRNAWFRETVRRLAGEG